MLQRIFLCFALLIVVSIQDLYAQKTVNASGKAQGRLEEDLSKDDLKEQLKMEAIQNAIENEFGILVEKESFIDVVNGRSYFDIESKSYLKGEWLKTTRVKYSEDYRRVKKRRRKPQELWLTCEIEGVIRKIDKPDIDMDFVTSGCPDRGCEKIEYLDGESLFLIFNAGVDGNLSIFVEEEGAAYRLLPYQQMTAPYINSVPIKAGQDYTFFSTSTENHSYPDFPLELVDELVMTCESGEEIMDMYLVFSTQPFSMPVPRQADNDHDAPYLLPKFIPMDDFEEWVQENRVHNVDFYTKKIRVKVRAR